MNLIPAQDQELSRIEGLGYGFGLLEKGKEGKTSQELISDLIRWPIELVTSRQSIRFYLGFWEAREFRREHFEFFTPTPNPNQSCE